MLTYLKAFIGSKIKNERGQGMVEYVLIIVAVALVALIGFEALGKAFGDDTNAGILKDIIDELK